MIIRLVASTREHIRRGGRTVAGGAALAVILLAVLALLGAPPPQPSDPAPARPGPLTGQQPGQGAPPAVHPPPALAAPATTTPAPPAATAPSPPPPPPPPPPVTEATQVLAEVCRTLFDDHPVERDDPDQHDAADPTLESFTFDSFPATTDAGGCQALVDALADGRAIKRLLEEAARGRYRFAPPAGDR